MRIASSLLATATFALIAASAIQAQDAAPAPKKYVDVAGPGTVGAPAATGEKIICKREVEIGSLVKGVRRCGTKEEWKRSSEAARKWTADIQDQKGRYQDPSSG